MRLSVTMAPVPTPKPSKPLLSSTVDLSSVVTDSMYVGFSSANGISLTTHCVLGWSFKMNGMAEPLDYAQLPPLPLLDSKHKPQKLAIWLPLVSCAFALLAVATVVWLVKRRNKYAELLEDWAGVRAAPVLVQRALPSYQGIQGQDAAWQRRLREGLPRRAAEHQRRSCGQASLSRIKTGDQGVRSGDREHRPAPTSERCAATGLLPPQGGAPLGLRLHAQRQPRQLPVPRNQACSQLGAEVPNHKRRGGGPTVPAPGLGADCHPP
ncbi:L-type lectin-domain containing receptor kinase IV.1-like [Iris pallida]|uniref:L-type lectin-domain containing receptor kinase IV.1-like n=1 Tax=Iris pallida TaxID=29817 RepID=A0AAX6GWG0_IRIPA|nr:L-type lectin-domain containing receptor kinase IV.1-like [Iris pallida]